MAASFRFWRRTEREELHRRVFAALADNVNYDHQPVLGVPASSLDDDVFNQDAHFLKDAPFISTMVANPNHIGCHTFGESESYFKGTQEIERELIELCAVDIFGAQPGQTDGYVASGGTEANIQAMWMYRNAFVRQDGARAHQIGLFCSADSHYCVDKAANLLGMPLFKAAVDPKNRSLSDDELQRCLKSAKQAGITHAVVMANMMTTMFGSVDGPSQWAEACRRAGLPFRLHLDGAFGGFYFPFASGEQQSQSALDFRNPDVHSITLDAHKMAQAPYGTGIFLARKGLIEHVLTPAASYVSGEDCTLIGSRSGANAIAVWMILQTHGPHGWAEKIYILQKRTAWLASQLAEREIPFFRHPASNIVTMRASAIPEETAQAHGLVPDSHQHPEWFKVVVMDHVTIERLDAFLEDLDRARKDEP